MTFECFIIAQILISQNTSTNTCDCTGQRHRPTRGKRARRVRAGSCTTSGAALARLGLSGTIGFPSGSRRRQRARRPCGREPAQVGRKGVCTVDTRCATESAKRRSDCKRKFRSVRRISWHMLLTRMFPLGMLLRRILLWRMLLPTPHAPIAHAPASHAPMTHAHYSAGSHGACSYDTCMVLYRMLLCHMFIHRILLRRMFLPSMIMLRMHLCACSYVACSHGTSS